jgi:hypothetical protein
MSDEEDESLIVNKLAKLLDKKLKPIHVSMEDMRVSMEKLVKLEKEVQQLRVKIKDEQTKNEELENEINMLRNRAIEQEDRNRRNNLIFFGIPKERNFESYADCEKIILKIIRESMKINITDYELDRVHRLGGNSNNSPPMIIRFLSWKVKEEVLKNSYRLRNTGIWISEDFSYETRQYRNKLRPFIRQAREEEKKVSLRYTTVIINGVKYQLSESEDCLVPIRKNPAHRPICLQRDGEDVAISHSCSSEDEDQRVERRTQKAVRRSKLEEKRHTGTKTSKNTVYTMNEKPASNARENQSTPGKRTIVQAASPETVVDNGRKKIKQGTEDIRGYLRRSHGQANVVTENEEIFQSPRENE